jgi:hypothetical protein
MNDDTLAYYLALGRGEEIVMQRRSLQTKSMKERKKDVSVSNCVSIIISRVMKTVHISENRNLGAVAK